VGRVGVRQSRHEGEKDRRRQREPDADPQKAGVEREIERTDGEARRIPGQHRHHRLRDRDAEHGAGAAEHEALGEQRAPQRGRARAQRGAHRQLRFPPHGPRQNQVRHVRAGDDEHQSRCGEQDEQHGPRLCRDLIAQPDGVNPEIVLDRIGFGVFLHDSAVDGAKFGSRRLHVGAWRQTAEQLSHPMLSSRHHRGRQVMRARDDVRDELGLGWIRYRRLQHADDDGRARGEPDGLADDRRIAVQAGHPEAVREHGRAVGARSVVMRVQEASQDRTQSHHLEVRAVDHARADLARLAEADHREGDGRELSQRRHRLQPAAQVDDLWHGERGVLGANPGRALADVDQTALVAVDQRPQQHASHDAEDGGVGADSQGQGEDYGRRQPLGAGQRAERELEIVEQVHVCSIQRPRGECVRTPHCASV
jgi:hypothetical protein